MTTNFSRFFIHTIILVSMLSAVLGGDAFSTRVPSIAALADHNINYHPTSECPGLVAYWPFDAETSLGVDASGGGSNLAINGNAAFTNEGRLGGGLQLDGDGDYLSGAVNGLPIGNNPYTLAAWFKTTSHGYQGILGWGAYGNVDKVNALRLANTTEEFNGLLNYWWSNDYHDDFFVPITSPDIHNGSWYHVAVTYDGVTRRMYLNGDLISTNVPGRVNGATLENFGIGRTAFSEYFNGALDEITVYNRELSAFEASLAPYANICDTTSTFGNY